MYKYLIFISIISLAKAKLSKIPVNLLEFNNVQEKRDFKNELADSFWVLDVDNNLLKNLKLRNGYKMEEFDFDKIFGAIIERLTAVFDQDYGSELDTDYFNPSLSVCFSGPYSSLTIKFGKKEWRFFIAPPSPLPKWFYQDLEHFRKDGKTEIEVPMNVVQEFYKSLLRMLPKFLNFTM